MRQKEISCALILLAGSMIFPLGSSYALTAPVAHNDFYTIPENGILDISGTGVLANDTSNGKTLSVLLVSNVKNGTLILNANGSFAYVPDLNFHGIDTFRYVATDGAIISNVSSVIITVGLVQSPIARNDSYVVDENFTLTVGGSGVLSNDTDPNGQQMQAILVGNTLNGHLSLNQNGSFSYTPNPKFHGTDSFTYKASDGLATSNSATVIVTVKETGVPSNGNPFLFLIAQIQDIISKITGIENKIIELEQQNNVLGNRVHQLEQEMQNIHSNSTGTNIQQNSDQGDQGDGGEHKDNSGHSKHDESQD